MRRLLPVLILLGCGLAAVGPGHGGFAFAATVYQCTGADGRKVFQDKPCRADQHQQVLDVPNVAAGSPPPAAAAPVPAAPDYAPPPAAPAAPTTALPLMYTCQRATDGKAYLSDNGNPAAYQVPYGMLDDDQASLAESYGADRGGAGISAPEANRGKVNSDMVANYYVWVQDACRPLDQDETCQALPDAYDDNEHKLRNAFKSQQPPLLRREAQLQAQLANCGG
jgi:hypothetical protein